MNKAKLLEQKAKPEGYMLTKEGLAAAPAPGKFPGSMGDVVLQLMAKSPDAPLTKGSLSENFWQKAELVLAELETKGLVKKADSGIELGKPRVVIENAARTSTLRLPGASKPQAFGLTKVVYGDKKGERLARKKHRGWKPVKY
jgi:hypothetical protein